MCLGRVPRPAFSRNGVRVADWKVVGASERRWVESLSIEDMVMWGIGGEISGVFIRPGIIHVCGNH